MDKQIESKHSWTEKRAAGNSTFAIGGVSCSADIVVVAETFVLRMNICAEMPAHRKSANRCGKIRSAIFF